jgi:type I restriction enzyme S subunit
MSVKFSNLGNEATIIMGQSPPGESYNQNGKGAPLLNGPSEFGLVHPRERQWTTIPTKFCEVGDVLFCVRGATAGRLNLAEKKYCIGRGLAAIRGKAGKLDSSFLRYVLANGYSTFQSRGVGSTFINISGDELARFPIPNLPLLEQRRIADILDRTDALRANRRAALAQLDPLTQSIFFQLFGDPNTSSQGWPRLALREVAHQITDGEHLTPRRTMEGIKLLSARNIRDGYIGVSDVDYISREEHERIKVRCNPEEGDVLISCSGTIGRVATVRIQEPISLVRSVALVKPKRDVIDSIFLEHYLRAPALRDKMSRSANASSQANLFQGQIRELPAMLPPLPLQREFARRVASVEKLKATQRASLAELDALFASLQHRAFRGEL